MASSVMVGGNTSNMVLNSDRARITGRQKVAILCMAVGPEIAAQITKGLSEDDAELISFEIARMEHVSGPVADAVLLEWLEIYRAAESLTEGGVEVAREILEKAFGPSHASQILKRIQAQLADTAGLHRLRNADPQQLGNMLRGEHPQTIALILAHLQPNHTANVLKHIDMALGSEVIYRMARMEKVSPEMLQLIERSIGAETDLAMEGMSASGGPAAVAEVLNQLTPTMEKELLDGVRVKDSELCDEIKNLMFVFEDIIKLDDRAIQRLLREIDSKELALSLKAASESLKGRILGAMSARAVASLQEEMDFLGPVRVRDVEAAQASIVTKVRELEEAGEIVMSGGKDDLVIN
ncbi:MAG TPA: flagellar motor switch protein FliG [Longimicrobiaceae bacterium]|nr:flagellar motor switch protein FliG [Longimicrobiaceae bacterium]